MLHNLVWSASSTMEGLPDLISQEMSPDITSRPTAILASIMRQPQSPGPLSLPLGQSGFHSGVWQPTEAPGPGYPNFMGLSAKHDFTFYLPVSALENIP